MSLQNFHYIHSAPLWVPLLHFHTIINILCAHASALHTHGASRVETGEDYVVSTVTNRLCCEQNTNKLTDLPFLCTQLRILV